jgi:hypothetical protein
MEPIWDARVSAMRFPDEEMFHLYREAEITEFADPAMRTGPGRIGA